MKTYEGNLWLVKPEKKIAFVFIILTVLLEFQVKRCVACVETERMGLLQLKAYLESLSSPEEQVSLESWSNDDSKSDCCKWAGVKCSDTIGGHIVHLTLTEIMPYPFDDSLLSLNISFLHSLTQLRSLDLSSNRLSHLFDPIHGYRSLARLKELRTLDLSNNYLDNSVLPFLSAARSLTTLNLDSNRLEGVFPPNDGSLERDDNWCSLVLERKYQMKLKLADMKELKMLDLAREAVVYIEVMEDGDQQLSSYEEFTDLDSPGLVFPSSLQVLKLAGNQFSITSEGYSNICGLTKLEKLNLSGRNLTTMPYCLGNLTRLRTLDLSNNQLNENLSTFVSGLPSTLEYLSLLDNNFNGSFLFSSLVNQKRLTQFLLSSKVGMVQAQADISSWVPLFQLEELTLQNFLLGSTIPGFLVHQHNLVTVDISYNQLTGAFPTWLVENNTRLQSLSMRSNFLTKFKLPMLVNGLDSLDISSNRIFDTIQEDIGIVGPKLRVMNFSSNHFHGTIPSSMGEMKSLEILDMSSNDLSGKLPKTFPSSCDSLTYLKLSKNQFQGNIFSEDANLTRIEMLLLDGNNFSSIGKGLSKSKNLLVFDMSKNYVSGKLPHWIGSLSSLSYLSMKGNQLKGPFPYQLLHSLLELRVMDISHNSFSGSIPRNVDFSYLLELRLQNNKFMGTIPDSLFEAEELQVLDLGNNIFSGKFMSTIGKRSSLWALLLRNNNLQSSVPEKICQLTRVSLLDLSHNKFIGDIPSCLGNMSFSAKRNDLVYNSTNYSSSSPDGHVPSTVVEYLTKNRYEAYQGDIIHNVCALDLSSNQLSGEIPVKIGDLENLISLNFSSNHLTGSIPDSISKLKDLESLDLSNNKLEGKIPPKLADLNNLGYFNVSRNNLSGEIPFKGHLVTFEEKSYVGNAHLCGLPTNRSCIPEEVVDPFASKQAEEEEGDGVIDMVWFYWTCGAVYISTSLALFVFLCIDSQWSQKWFYRVDLFVHRLQCFNGRAVCN